MQDKKLKVTQIEVAVRQLDTAINLFFDDRDAVSVHSLVMNAEEIVSGLIKEMGDDSVFCLLKKEVKPDKINEFMDLVNEFRNACKHRKYREEKILEFPLDLNELYIAMCVNSVLSHWKNLVKDYPGILIFALWHFKSDPEFYSDTFKKSMNNLDLDLGVSVEDKKIFYVKYIDAVKDIGLN